MQELESSPIEVDNFIYCLEVVPDEDVVQSTPVVTILESMALEQHITSIYKTCDTIESLEASIDSLLYEDEHFSGYDIIYLVLPGEANSILINGYYYTIEEIAELFTGKMEGKVIHFANKKVLDLTDEECQYFLDVTGARAVSGYGSSSKHISSAFTRDRRFFNLFYRNDDLKEVVRRMFFKHPNLCTQLDFRLYY